MVNFNGNPFARRESHNVKAVWAYKILTTLTWLLSVVVSVYYTFGHLKHGKKHREHTVWDQNRHYPTPFALNSIITSIYWLVLFILQIGYVWHLFSNNNDYVQAAAGVGSHFILNNLLHSGFLALFVRSQFYWAELVLVVNFINLSALYFRHSKYPRFIHLPAVSGPLAWTFVALYWNGAIAVNAHSLPARIIANVAIWGILVYGLFFLVVYKDYTIGFALSVLTASLGVGQFFTRTIAFQWIFAFVILGVLFLATVVIALPGIFGEPNFHRGGGVVPADQERAPLLDDA